VEEAGRHVPASLGLAAAEPGIKRSADKDIGNDVLADYPVRDHLGTRQDAQ